MLDPQQFLRDLFDAAVEIAQPEIAMRRWLPERPDGKIIVIGAGKAAAAMAKTLESMWGKPLSGAVIAPYGYGVDCQQIEVIEAAHPVPDAAGVAAAQKLVGLVSDLVADDTVVCLISGGGSSLLCAPAEGITLQQKQHIGSALLASGASIHEINCVRKKLSRIKGGKLALAAAPAKVLTLVISDVPGNDAATVASGPTMTDHGSAEEALAILERYGIAIDSAVRSTILRHRFQPVASEDVRILVTSDDAILAGSALAVERGVTPYSLGDLSGDARDLAVEHAQLVRDIIAGTGPVRAPCVLLSGGETTMKITGNGRGGRNGEYGLALAIELDGLPNVDAIACDTDGLDGTGSNAGCRVSPDTLRRARAASIDPLEAQSNNDSFGFFEALGDLVVTGPTYTNVNDFRAVLINAKEI